VPVSREAVSGLVVSGLFMQFEPRQLLSKKRQRFAGTDLIFPKQAVNVYAITVNPIVRQIEIKAVNRTVDAIM
jgi:hypothetical protein